MVSNNQSLYNTSPRFYRSYLALAYLVDSQITFSFRLNLLLEKQVWAVSHLFIALRRDCHLVLLAVGTYPAGRVYCIPNQRELRLVVPDHASKHPAEVNSNFNCELLDIICSDILICELLAAIHDGK
jgi:hypothetical protein